MAPSPPPLTSLGRHHGRSSPGSSPAQTTCAPSTHGIPKSRPRFLSLPVRGRRFRALTYASPNPRFPSLPVRGWRFRALDPWRPQIPGSSPFPFADGASARRRSCPQFLPRFGASPHRGTTPSPWGTDNVDSAWPHRSETNPATVALLLTDKDLESEESMYERWSSVHTVSRDLTEKQSRFEAFKANSRHIGKFNKMKDVPYKLGLNKGLAIDNLDYIFTVGAPSIINHRSCVPNAFLIFDGRTAYVRALQPINKDEEVSISYIETAAVTKKRNNDLKQYFFTCTCPRCVKGFDEDALLEGFRCKNQACDGFLLPNSDKAEAGSIYKIIEQLERNLYHAFSTTLLHTCETLLKIYLELQDWWTALTYCRLIIPVYERRNTEGSNQYPYVSPSGSGSAAGAVACIACPTLYAYLKKTDPGVPAQLLEYDERFGQYGCDFTFYDYNRPEELSAAMKHAYRVIVADPPYLSKECLEKVAKTVSFLAQPKGSFLLLLTGDASPSDAAPVKKESESQAWLGLGPNVVKSNLNLS
ncbi:Histone-lysine N-methyltransferase ASHR1 [Zea mays]|uniref:Histone-lysine N-methyltransferase ASHR1 n=1 Tax=Zea mays TaxID=4577 RepID=A0A3L6EQY0_MAIZE|nr:Histone-lysine N-methyltransferase ASHR1 [Zea mays]